MGEEVKYDATLVVQRRELGLEYLLQVDSKAGRMFIDREGSRTDGNDAGIRLVIHRDALSLARGSGNVPLTTLQRRG